MHEVWEKAVDWAEPLWRYMSTKRCIGLLETSQIHFAAAAQFSDNFEGAVAVLAPNFQIDPRYPLEDDFGERAFRALTRLTKVNCWHRSD